MKKKDCMVLINSAQKVFLKINMDSTWLLMIYGFFIKTSIYFNFVFMVDPRFLECNDARMTRCMTKHIQAIQRCENIANTAAAKSSCILDLNIEADVNCAECLCYLMLKVGVEKQAITKVDADCALLWA